MKLKKKIATIALVILVTATVFWVFRSEKGFPNCYSTVKAATPSLAVYSDSEAQSPLTTVNWGTVTLGVASTATFYLKNTGSSSFLLESPTASDFVYEDASDNVLSGDYSQDFTLTLNCTGVQLSPGSIIPAQLSLVIGSGIDSSIVYFSFNIGLGISGIQLNAGWNQVSFSAVPANPNLSSVLSGISGAEAVTWNGSSYTTPTTVTAGQSYLIFVPSSQTLTLTGTPQTTCTVNLNAGWNMVGSVYGQTVSASSVFSGYYQLETWAGTSYQAATTIQDSSGYWVFVLSAQTITLQ